MIDAKMSFSDNAIADVINMAQISMQRRQSMWDFHNYAISAIVPGTPKQKYLIELTNTFNA